MKAINIILSLIIIVDAAITCHNGGQPGWLTFFLGWGLLLWHEITE